MSQFSVVLIRPEGYVHSLGLAEVCETLAAALRDLGHQATITTNRLRSDHQNIVVGWHLLRTWPAGMASTPVIVYQLEQLSDREGWWTEQRKALLKTTSAVWDYSLENVVFLERQGIHARHVPLGGHPGMNRIACRPEDERDVEILFYGSMNERRAGVLHQIGSRGMVLRTLFNVYGPDRDQWIGRSKIALNLHYYDTQIPEQVRLSYLLNNGCFVISEGPSPYSGGLVTGDPDQIPEMCAYYLNRPQERREIAYQGHQLLPAMTESLLPVLTTSEAACAV